MKVLMTKETLVRCDLSVLPFLPVVSLRPNFGDALGESTGEMLGGGGTLLEAGESFANLPSICTCV